MFAYSEAGVVNFPTRDREIDGRSGKLPPPSAPRILSTSGGRLQVPGLGYPASHSYSMEPARENNFNHGQLRRDRQQGSCVEMLPPASISTARCLSRVEIGAGGNMGADNPTCSPTTTLSVDLGELVPTLSFCVENRGTQNHLFWLAVSYILFLLTN